MSWFNNKTSEGLTLEEQLRVLAELGLKLNEGVSVDDLLYSFSRDEYEVEPFDLVLFALGIEVERAPWGRAICSRVWNFDLECIEDTGDYVSIVTRLSEVAGQPDLITHIQDHVDLESGEAWLKYRIDGEARHYTVAVDNDWADPATISAIVSDLNRDRYRFYAKDNGQAAILFYLDRKTAKQLNKLSGGAVKPWG